MDRPIEVDDEEIEVDATMLLTADDLDIVMKALDCYAYALIMAQAVGELERVKQVAMAIVQSCPKPELDS
jgi:hypothetical protein